MEKYDHKEIESKWQKKWWDNEVDKVGSDPTKPKCYILDMFPYPSGEGLHVGHPKGYIATDVYSRMKKMQGFNILHPMGWDAFGLPAENYALKNKVHPKVAVDKNIATYKSQLKKIGFNYDWEREIDTTDPEYYKWTQWIFLKMFEKGLAYESYEPINWCPSCQTGLANEDLEGGKCERCGSEVEKKPMRQWVLKITDYADRLLTDLDGQGLKWPEYIKESQKNWIGRSEGAEINFKLKDFKIQSELKIFTTRPDTIYGVTFMAISPEAADAWLKAGWETSEEIKKYVADTLASRAKQTFKDNPEKTGIFSGVYAINPVNNEEVPVWVTNYVLGDIGTGAIMAVPAHDYRDNEFAHKYELPIKPVIQGFVEYWDDQGITLTRRTFTPNSPEVRIKDDKLLLALKQQAENDLAKGRIFCDPGALFDSGEFSGLYSDYAKQKITEKFGQPKVTYKLKDWVFSRQRYWGEPIPIIHCEKCKENIEKNSTEVNFYEQDTWSRLINGEKTIESRALNPEERDRYFGNIKKGDHFKAINKLTSESRYFEVNKVWQYKNVKELFTDKEVLTKIYAPKNVPDSLEQLEADYKYTDDYVDRMNKNGIIAWEVKIIIPGAVAVPEQDLPVKLPEVEHYEPSGTGESPLANITDWVNTTCPKCGGAGKRETNTMPQWAGSSWYYLAYCVKDFQTKTYNLLEKNKIDYWLGPVDPVRNREGSQGASVSNGVDMYVGGAEHATRHLIYARFWHKFLYDIGVVSNLEPFTELHNVGLILAEDGKKMSKRYNNVVNPDEVVDLYGADTLRVYEMFMGPFSDEIAWKTDAIIGSRRFLEKVWRVMDKIGETEPDNTLHLTIKKVGEDIANFRFNTAISTMMIQLNDWDKKEFINKADFESFLRLLAPFAPHLADELWSQLGHPESVHLAKWPEYDISKSSVSEVKIAVQVDGRVRGTILVSPTDPQEAVQKQALIIPEVAKWLEGKEPKKVIYVAGRIINFLS